MRALLAGIRTAPGPRTTADPLIVAPRRRAAPPAGRRAALAAGPAILALALVAGGRAAQFSAGTELVEVYATVVDAKGEPVIDLPADAFTVLEEGARQPVSAFTAGEFPLTVAIALDRSFSMTDRGLLTARAGAIRLLDQLRARDRVRILATGGGTEIVAGPDTPRERARDALTRVTLWGSSPIGDTVAQAVEAVGADRGRRAVVLLSDGIEREAERPRGDVLDLVRRSGVLVYPIATARTVSPLLAELAALSGGRLQQARDRQAAERAAMAIARELRHQYLLGYAPPPGPAGWRRIEVRVDRPGLRVRARLGYHAAVAPPRAAS
jgi:Ca-activated chloride channel family protein